MGDRERLQRYVETWRHAVEHLVELARELPEDDWHRPTDLPGWDVQDNVAHTAHLEAVLAGAPEETLTVDAGGHVRDLAGYYTEQGVLARRDKTMAELLEELERSVALRYDALRADPPDDGSAAPPRTPGGIGWNTETLLRNRPLDVWMHLQDIRRAVGRPGNYDCAAAAHTIGLLGAGLPMVLGKRVAPPAGTSVRIDVPEADYSVAVVVGDDGRAAPVRDLADPSAAIELGAEAFVVLAGGRRTPDQVQARVHGDEDLGRRVLANLAVTP